MDYIYKRTDVFEQLLEQWLESNLKRNLAETSYYQLDKINQEMAKNKYI